METLRGSDLRRIEQFIDALVSRKQNEISLQFNRAMTVKRARAEKEIKTNKFFKTILKKRIEIQAQIKQAEQKGKFSFEEPYSGKPLFALGHRWESICQVSLVEQKHARLDLLAQKVCKVKELLIFSDKKKILAEIKKLELV